CGRLMCSLRYEHEFYVQSRKRFPKEGKVLVTARGEEKVVANDIFRDRVTLRALDGEMRVVALADLRAELAGASGDRESAFVPTGPEPEPEPYPAPEQVTIVEAAAVEVMLEDDEDDVDEDDVLASD